MTTWTRVDSGSSPGNLVADIVVVDALNIVAITSDSRVLRSTDSGVTFAEVVGALPVGAAAFDMAAGNGVVVIQGTDAGVHALFTSSDGGATWTNTTPIGNVSQGSAISFLPGFGKFITCEGAAANFIWSSSDGVAWTGTPVVGIPGYTVGSFTRQYVVEGANGAVFAGYMTGPDTYFVLANSPDGITWTPFAFYGTVVTIDGGTISWNGVAYNACWLVDGTIYFNEASLDGLTPAYGTSGGAPPPFPNAQAVLNGDIYCSSFVTNDIGVSTDDAASWLPDVIPDVTFADLLSLPAEILASGEALVVNDGVSWVTELGPIPGFINRTAYGLGLTFAVGLISGDGGIWRRDVAPSQVEVPPIANLTPTAGNMAIVAASLVPGVPTTEGSLTVPLGLIIRQSPAGGTLVDIGTVVNYVVSSGFIEAPDLYKDTAAQANAELALVGLGVGPATSGFSDSVKYGSVMAQVPPAGTHLLPGAFVSYTISVPRSDFDVDQTVISQYQNSPTLLRLVHNMDEYIDEGKTLANFYQYIWNVDTAVGFGLDIWGRIVGVSRLLQIPGNDPIVGFDNASVPKDWYPMSEGRFATENEVTTAYELPDDAYRVLVLTKALANIITTTAPALNQLLRNMFPGRGRAFVRDLGNMAMQFVFNFSLTPVEYAILTQSGVLPHPAGVFYSVTVIPGGLFGFQGYTGALPFNYGVFNSRP